MLGDEQKNRLQCSRKKKVMNLPGSCRVVRAPPVLRGHYIVANFYTVSSTVCPGSSDPFYIASYYVNWFTTSWTYSMKIPCGIYWCE